MHLILNKELVEQDTVHVGDDESIPAEGQITVSLNRWLEQQEALRQRSAPVGVRLHGEDDVREHADAILDRPLIALEFPKFADGRCYSHARILREQLGYEGQLRAIGDILRDQVFFYNRCGINALELRPDRCAEVAMTAFNDFSVTYQPAADEPNPLFRRR